MTKIISSVSKRQVEFSASGKARGTAAGTVVRNKNIIDKAFLTSNVVNLTSDDLKLPGHEMRVTFAENNTWYISSANNLSTSADGINWVAGSPFPLTIATIAPIKNPITNTMIFSTASTATNLVRTTDFCSSFTTPTLPVSAICRVGYGNGRWIAAPTSASTTFLYSDDDGITWNTGAAAPFTPTFNWGNPIYFKGVWIVPSAYQSNYALSTNNGSSWISYTPSAGSSTAMLSTSKYLIRSDGGFVYTSQDGYTWYTSSSAKQQYHSIIFATENRLFLGGYYKEMLVADNDDYTNLVPVCDTYGMSGMLAVMNNKVLQCASWSGARLFDNPYIHPSRTVTY